MFKIEYEIVNPRKQNPRRVVEVQATRSEISHLVEKGYFVMRSMLPGDAIDVMKNALTEINRHEKLTAPEKVDYCFGGIYLRHLVDKHECFLSLFRLKQTCSIARAVLGPQIQFDEVVARMVDLSIPGQLAPWHIHLRAVPVPIPPFFSYPHSINCLLYLDEATVETGALCVLPGSHRLPALKYPYDDIEDKSGQEVLELQRGDCVVMHGNLWHRTTPYRKMSSWRRLIIFGYLPSWMRGEELGGIKPQSSAIAPYRDSEDVEERELAGKFVWE